MTGASRLSALTKHKFAAGQLQLSHLFLLSVSLLRIGQLRAAEEPGTPDSTRG